MWNYLQGGKDNYQVDRTTGDKLIFKFPRLSDMALAAKMFTQRVVRYLTDQGIDQLIDIGCGFPPDNEAIRRLAPGAHIVYVDNDPTVIAYAQAGLKSGTAVKADLRDVHQILLQAGEALDLSRPTALLYKAVLPYILDHAQALAAMRSMTEALAPGSYVVITRESADEDPCLVNAMEWYAKLGGPELKERTKEEILEFVAGLQVAESTPNAKKLDWLPCYPLPVRNLIRLGDPLGRSSVFRSRPGAACSPPVVRRWVRVVEVEPEHDPVGRRAVVAGDGTGDGEPQGGVEGDRAVVVRGGDRLHHGTAIGAGEFEEPPVHAAGQPPAPEAGIDADEVDVGDFRSRGRQEPHQKARQVAVMLGHDARAVEVVEEQPGEGGPDRTPPPVVHDGDDGVVVGGLGRSQPDVVDHDRQCPRAP